MKPPTFIHLRVHTEYSLLEGALRVKKLPGQVAAMGSPAVAVTDSNNMFCALEFSELAAKAGVQPILGCQVDLRAVDPLPGETPVAPAPIVLLAQSEAGYRNLMKLNSALYLRGDGAVPHVTLSEVEAHAAGLICLTGGPDGPLGRACWRRANRRRPRRWSTGWPQRFPTGFMSSCSVIRARAACPRPRP